MKKVLATLIVVFFWLPSLVLATDQININAASLVQLDQLIGVGPAIAQRIIDGRPYASLDDLLRVSGIGPKTLQKIKNQGLASVTATSLPKVEKSDTTGNEALAATSELIKDAPHQQNTTANPWPLFWGTLGTISITGVLLLFIKLKH